LVVNRKVGIRIKFGWVVGTGVVRLLSMNTFPITANKSFIGTLFAISN